MKYVALKFSPPGKVPRFFTPLPSPQVNIDVTRVLKSLSLCPCIVGLVCMQLRLTIHSTVDHECAYKTPLQHFGGGSGNETSIVHSLWMTAWYEDAMLGIKLWLCPAMHEQPQIQLPNKNKGVDVIQSQPLHRTCYQASWSPAVLDWLGDGNCYLMQSGGWLCHLIAPPCICIYTHSLPARLMIETWYSILRAM